jgi:hypothetical protein
LLILSLFHVPLPQPDFHNVRHHDAPGEVCEHHDHLLRWHPQATGAEDVSILHWHWFLPTATGLDLSGAGESLAIHAHVADWDAPTLQVGHPVVSQVSVRIHDTAKPILWQIDSLSPPSSELSIPIRSGSFQIHAFSATFAPQTSLACLLQRWSC